MIYKIYIFVILTLGSFFFASAQSERKITRKGNTHYETGNFIDAEINYKKALEKNSDLLEAQFNLGDALVKQERFDEALESFEKVSASTEDQNLKANALHNKGNVLLSQQDLEGAIESYKDALRINPKDQETRYNYAYVKKLLDQQQQQQNQDKEQNEDNQEENKEEDKEQNEEGNDQEDQKNEGSENKDQENSENEDDKQDQQDQQDEGGNNNDETEQNQQDKGQTDGEDSNEENQGEQPNPRENKLSPEEAQRLLDALNQQEEKVQDKMKKHKLKGAKVKIEKDW